MTTTARHYYAAAWTASAPVAIEECVQVKAFSSRLARDAWVAEGMRGSYYGTADDVGSWVRASSREPLTQAEAARYLAAIARGAYGGRQSGREALRHLAVAE